MINFEKLNKTKIYLGLQYGTSLIAKKIKKYSKYYAPDTDDIPTHVLTLVYREFHNVENANMDCRVTRPSVFARGKCEGCVQPVIFTPEAIYTAGGFAKTDMLDASGMPPYIYPPSKDGLG